VKHPLWAIRGEPDYRLRHASLGKLGATLDPGAWARAQIVPTDWVREPSKIIVTVREGVGYAYSGWIQRQPVRWFTDASYRVHLWEIDARLGGRYRHYTDKETAVINNVREFERPGEILEFDPPRLLVYNRTASEHVNKSRRTTARWELISDASGTHVKVTHSGLANEEADALEM
jgi:hypothetical protein